jgi:CubicO group peptidase (beta-lactamase class C family)
MQLFGNEAIERAGQINYGGHHMNNKISVRISVLCFLAVAFVSWAKPLHGQNPTTLNPLQPAARAKVATSPPEAPRDSHALTADDLAAFTDSILPFQLKQENIAGAVIIVVKDGNVLFKKGYGYADVAKKTPVTPDGTLFRPGSISKLFTWTAVMQLVEQGKLDLDRDINDYLDFKIAATYPKPITLRNLMTHTPGFEEAVKDLIVTRSSMMIPLQQYVSTHMPQRVYAPGTTPAYSNYGATLAGYIVQRVSGMPFDDYVEKSIFGPLGMSNTTFRQPLPPQLESLMSSGYALATSKAKPYEFVVPAPAGSSATSAIDISHFMIAHLQNGEFNGARILKPETVALMHSAQFGVNPSLPKMALGFYEETRNGHRIIGHGGDTEYFHSDLHLILDANVGFFISYNSAGRHETDARGVLFDMFIDRYFPYAIPSAPNPADAAGDARLVAGEYISSRRPVTNILSFLGFLSEAKVTPAEDGTITIDIFKGLNQLPITWQEIGPLLYREKDGQHLVGFTRDSDNRLVLAMNYPFMVWTKVSLAGNAAINIFLVVFTLAVCLLTLVLWPVSAWLRRHYKHPIVLTQSQRRFRLAIRMVAAIDLVFIVCWLVLVISSSNSNPFVSSFDPMLRVMQIVGWLGSLGTLLVFYAVIKTWGSTGEWWLSHLGNLSMSAAALSFSWFLLHWHLLHFSLMY